MCLFNPARVRTAVLWMRAADWFTVLYVCERGETAQPYLSEPTAGYHCAVAHPDNPARAGPIDMLMAGLVAWNCHPVCIVRSNSASLGSALFTARFPRRRQGATQSYRQSRRFPRFLTAKFSIFQAAKATIKKSIGAIGFFPICNHEYAVRKFYLYNY